MSSLLQLEKSNYQDYHCHDHCSNYKLESDCLLHAVYPSPCLLTYFAAAYLLSPVQHLHSFHMHCNNPAKSRNIFSYLYQVPQKVT